MRFPSRAAVAPYAVFFWAALAMLVVGGSLQLFLPLQWGLLATEVFVVLGIALALRYFLERVDLGVEWGSLRRWGLGRGATLLLVISAPLMGILANVVAALMVEIIPPLQPLAEQYEGMTKSLFPPDDPLLWAAGAVSIVVAAPFCEEFLFRGTILQLQERAHRNTALIVALNGILFGAIHFNPLSFVALSIVGAFLAHVTLRSRSVWPAIVGHAVLNGCNGLIFPRFAEAAEETADAATLLELLGALGVVAPIAIGAWWLLMRAIRD